MATGKQRQRERQQRMNNAIGVYARFTRIVPKGLRHRVRDWLIRVTTPQEASYRLPLPREGRRIRKGINLYGSFREETGLGQGVRMYARGIEAAGIRHCFLHTDFLEWLGKDEHSFDRKLTRRARYGVNVVHINPDQWILACEGFPNRCFDRRYNIGVWLWELPRMPESWKETLAYVDELWVPSEFIARAIRAETDKPVTVIRYGVETPVSGEKRADFGLPEDKLLVLAMFDSHSYASRKNPLAAVEAFTEAFGGTDGAELVLKVNHPHEEDVAKVEEKLREAKVRYTLITERMPKEKLNALIACCDIFLSLHRSEGFGFPVAEAMALGTVTVATNWSSTAEFMSKETTCPVGYKLIPVGENEYPNWEGQEWADPDVHEAAAYLKELAADPEKRQRIAEAAKAYMREELSPAACGQRMKARLEEIIQNS